MQSETVPQAALDWAGGQLGSEWQAEPLRGDASSRRYVRLQGAGHLLMLSPPGQGENNDAFLSVRAALQQAGVRVPALAACEQAQGWFLLEDLGDTTLAQVLDDEARREDWLRRALDLLPRMRRCSPQPPPPPHHGERQGAEMQLWLDWYQRDLLAAPLPEPLLAGVQAELRALVQRLADHAQGFVHYDFHSFNLMVLPDGELAVLDFQDAVVGSLALDLVSLVKDCYRLYPPQLRAQLLEHAARAARDSGELDKGQAELVPLWAEQIGLQRHLRVLGTFARLWLRDGKSAYLGDLPLVLRYAQEAAEGLGLHAVADALHASRQPLEAFLAGRDEAGRGQRDSGGMGGAGPGAPETGG